MKVAVNETNKALSKLMQNLWLKKTGGSYPKLELLSQIEEITFQKWLSGARKIERSDLAKFVIGLSLDRETADELFALQSHSLDYENNRFDFIVACAIRDKDDIEQFAKDVFTYCKFQLF